MKKALYFMPDISGFTNFVTTTEMEHSVHIIAELLEILIDQNQLELELVEIEGDALFMYTTKIPDYEQLMQQTYNMLNEFHFHTEKYEKLRVCNCGSCRTAINLKLKFVVHYGDLFFINVKDITKPYGNDVIKIHRLLKNDIVSNQYLLLTKEAFELFEKEADGNWQQSDAEHDRKRLEYYYKNLDPIKIEPKVEEKFAVATLDYGQPDIEIEKTFTANADVIYKYVSELKYRTLWNKEVRKLTFNPNKINRGGTKHKCIFNVGKLKFETLSVVDKDSLVYGEQTKDLLFTKDLYFFIELDKIDVNITKVKLRVFIDFTALGTYIKYTIIDKISSSWNDLLDALHDLSKKDPITNDRL
jgi:hypothetical protein